MLGYPRPLARVVAALTAEAGLVASPASMADEAVAASGGDPRGIRSKVDVELSAGMRRTAAPAALRELAGFAEDNLSGTLADLDTEFLHDLVGGRAPQPLGPARDEGRLRSPSPSSPSGRTEVDPGHHRRHPGPRRPASSGTSCWPGSSPIATPPCCRCAPCWPGTGLAALRKLKAELRSRGYRDAWAGANKLPRRQAGPGPGAPGRQTADRRRGRRAHPHGLQEDGGPGLGHRRHEPGRGPARAGQRGKELRYLLEFFGGLWPSSVAKPMVKTLKGLQDVLGTHQDREVQADHLRSLADELAGVVGGLEALLVLGVLVDRLEAEQRGGPRPLRRAVRRLRRQGPAQAGVGHVPGAERVKVLATYNIKGGVGKTSAAVNAAALAAADGLRTLLWILDPQGAASFLPGPAQGPGRRPHPGGAQRRHRRPARDRRRGGSTSCRPTSYRHMDLALDATGKPTRWLRRVLAPLQEHYDLAVIDCPPSISLVSESVSSTPPTPFWSRSSPPH